MKTNNIVMVVVICIILYVMRSVFITEIVVGGDYISPFYTYYFGGYNPFSVWNPTYQLGWGAIPLLHYAPINFLIGMVHNVFPQYSDRIIWWIPFFVLSFVSSLYLTHIVFPGKKLPSLSPLIFVLNSYILMVLAGGQIAGIGLAYALVPLIFGIFYSLILSQTGNYKKSIVLGLILSTQLIFDIRITYVTLVGIVVIFLSIIFGYSFSIKKIVTSTIKGLGIPGIIMALLHLFWLLPTVLYKSNPIDDLGKAYSSIEAVKFFSFAKFENTIGILHPNWPDNIFGKVEFMRPEFLVITVIAFSSLLFIHHEKKSIKLSVISFVALSLIGSFLAKGASDPGGFIYTGMFEYIPGFIMFRDPFKWYVLTISAYAVLIPFALTNYCKLLAQFRLFHKTAEIGVVLLFIFFWLVIHRDAVSGQIRGTFTQREMPLQYAEYNEFLNSQNEYFRTLWIPSVTRFTYSSPNHPAVSYSKIFSQEVEASISSVLSSSTGLRVLQDASIKYVVVPDDTEGEVFLDNRKYSEAKYHQMVQEIKNIDYLQEVEEFGKIKVFKVPNPRDHYYLVNSQGSVTYKNTNPTKYELTIENVREDDILVFSEQIDNGWILKIDNQNITPVPYLDSLNSYPLPKSGSYSAIMYYSPQDLVNRGIFVSGITFISILGTLGYLHTKRKARKHGH